MSEYQEYLCWEEKIKTAMFGRDMLIFHNLNPKFSRDGNQYCFLYGENLHDGIAGFGDTVEQAMLNFIKAIKEEKITGDYKKQFVIKGSLVR